MVLQDEDPSAAADIADDTRSQRSPYVEEQLVAAPTGEVGQLGPAGELLPRHHPSASLRQRGQDEDGLPGQVERAEPDACRAARGVHPEALVHQR